MLPTLESTLSLSGFPSAEKAKEYVGILGKMDKLTKYIVGLSKSYPAELRSLQPVFAFARALLDPRDLQKNFDVRVFQEDMVEDSDGTWRMSVRMSLVQKPFKPGEKVKIECSGLKKPYNRIHSGTVVGPSDEHEECVIVNTAKVGDVTYHEALLAHM